jgi:hypothetical protein
VKGDVEAGRVWWLSAHPGSGISGPYTEAEAADLWARRPEWETGTRVYRTTPDGTGRELVTAPPWAAG